MDTRLLILYSNFKKRVYSYATLSAPWSPSSSSSSSSSSPFPSSSDDSSSTSSMDELPIQMLYLISNMMSIFEDDREDDNILLYWPYKQDESYIKTCIVDRQFERTNIKNDFHLVHYQVLMKNLSSSSSSSSLEFTQCSCSNHRNDLVFDWNEFIPSVFVKTLYNHLLNNPLYKETLSYSRHPSVYATEEHDAPSIPWEELTGEFLTHERIRTMEIPVTTTVSIKPMTLPEDITIESFDTMQVLVLSSSLSHSV